MRVTENRGFSLVQVLVAAGLMASLGVALLQMMGGMNRDMASISQRGTVEELRMVLRRRLSCARSFPTGVCSIGGNGQVALKDVYNADILTEIDTESKSIPGKAAFFGAYKYGTARIRTTCSSGRLEIRVSNWMKPASAWPTIASVATCQEILGGAFTNKCGPSQKMMGVNKETLEPICVTNDFNCVGGQYLKGMTFNADGSPLPICRSLPTACPDGQLMQGTTWDADGNASMLCDAKVIALENVQRNMLSRRCHRINNYADFADTGAPVTPIRGFEANGEPLCAGVAGDMDGDGYGDLLTGAWAGGGPRISFRYGPNGADRGGDFYAYGSGFRGGASVGLVDFNGDGKADVLTGAGAGGGPHMRVYFSPPSMGVAPDGSKHSEISQFMPQPEFRGGIIVGP